MPDTAFADDAGERYPSLHQFLAGWFHEDWAVDDDSWEHVVDAYVGESPRASVAATRAELEALLASSDAEVGAALDGIGCSVDPAAFQLSARGWLEQVRDRLRA